MDTTRIHNTKRIIRGTAYFAAEMHSKSRESVQHKMTISIKLCGNVCCIECKEAVLAKQYTDYIDSLLALFRVVCWLRWSAAEFDR